ncbi:MAG: ATP-dependent Clp protease adaptor ClpS [Desulfuromonadaceae bacterium]|nr:ATP-dependent Clp protease adaptor ClpS [Desulfuromonadaceae bacterium]
MVPRNPSRSGTCTTTRTEKKTQAVEPPRFSVVMHNDDYTTMEFVIEVLCTLFHKSATEATHLMLKIHHEGQAICGCYPFEIAETKVARTHQLAKKAGYPLRCSLLEA